MKKLKLLILIAYLLFVFCPFVAKTQNIEDDTTFINLDGDGGLMVLCSLSHYVKFSFPRLNPYESIGEIFVNFWYELPEGVFFLFFVLM